MTQKRGDRKKSSRLLKARFVSGSFTKTQSHYNIIYMYFVIDKSIYRNKGGIYSLNNSHIYNFIIF